MTKNNLEVQGKIMGWLVKQQTKDILGWSKDKFSDLVQIVKFHAQQSLT